MSKTWLLGYVKVEVGVCMVLYSFAVLEGKLSKPKVAKRERGVLCSNRGEIWE